MDKKDFEWIFRSLRLANIGAAEAKETAHKKGIPYVATINGKPVYIIPDGKVRTSYKYASKA
jgi:hypothetical protein